MPEKINNSEPKEEKSGGKSKFARFLAVCLAIVFLWYFNNYTIKINRTERSSEKISAAITAVVLSDMHSDGTNISGRSVMDKVEKIEPDIVFVLGDMYSRGASEEQMQIPIDFMGNLAAHYPTYFVPGDHDTSYRYIKSLLDVGVHVMAYQYGSEELYLEETVEIKGNKLHIMGIDNVYYSDTFDLSSEFTNDPDCFNILLAHIPNYEKFAEFGADLTLCADTHGGMARLPFNLGPVYDSLTGEWFPRQRSNRTVYDKGWFEYENGAMFITSGIGDSPYPVRMFNRPEIVAIEIDPE
ncbi:MAG: metallophosphoesterase [Alistipes sp.]|nr:metallophosphoesterase [Alistipes sp.]